LDSDGYADEGDDYAGFEEAGSEVQSFGSQQFKYARSRIDDQYKAEAKAYVNKLSVSSRLKKEYYSCIYALFAPSNVLANNAPRVHGFFIKSDPLKPLLIFAELYIKKVAACSATQGDKFKYDVGALEHNLLMVYTSYLTRSLGPDREGVTNGTSRAESITREERARDSINLDVHKKTGILGFGGK